MTSNNTSLPSDLRLIGEFRRTAPGLSEVELGAGRAKLMSALLAEPTPASRRASRHASRRALLPRRAPLAVSFGGVVAAVVALATLMPFSGPQETASPVKFSLAAKILRGAANHYAQLADGGGVTEPGPKQWIYFTFVQSGIQGGPLSTGDWTTFDGTRAAGITDNGALKVSSMTTMPVPRGSSALEAYDLFPSPMNVYNALAYLAQDDPSTLLAVVHADASKNPPKWISPSEAPFITMPPAAALDYEWLQALLQNTYLAPPGAEAAVFRAMSTLPGLGVVQGLTSATGAPALGITYDGGITDLMFSPSDDAYIGVRSIDTPAAPSTTSTATTNTDTTVTETVPALTSTTAGADPPVVYTRTTVKLVSGPGVR
jgi:hypothetical protein